MKVKTKPELMQSMKHYQKLAAERLHKISDLELKKVAIENSHAGLQIEITELKKEIIKLQAKVFMMQSPENKGNPKYDVTIYGKYGTGSCVVDVYRMLDACKVTSPQLQHLSKKALFSGLRGHKDTRQDLVDILDSAKSALDMHDDKNNK